MALMWLADLATGLTGVPAVDKPAADEKPVAKKPSAPPRVKKEPAAAANSSTAAAAAPVAAAARPNGSTELTRDSMIRFLHQKGDVSMRTVMEEFGLTNKQCPQATKDLFKQLAQELFQKKERVCSHVCCMPNIGAVLQSSLPVTSTPHDLLIHGSLHSCDRSPA